VIRVVWRGAAAFVGMALVGLTPLLSSCSSSKSEAAKPAALADIKPTLNVRTAWRVTVGGARGAPLQPAVLENAVYAAANSGTVLRVAPASGEVVWRIDADAKLTSGVGSDGFVVAVATTRGELLTFGADGKPGWRAQLPSDALVTPLVGRGLVIVRTTDQRVTAFEIDSGKRRWTYSRAAPPLTLRTTSDMVFAGDNVIVGFPGGRMVALALTNGAARWEAVVTEPKGATEVERLADVVGAIAISGRDACAAAFQGRMACVDNINGNLRWAREHAAGGGVALDERHIYSVDAKGAVVALARDSGASVWRNETLANRELSTPLALPSAILTGDFEGYVHFMRPDSGEFAARVRLDGAISAAPRAWGNGAIVQSQGGTLAFLSVER
jgi:outer membrane protein assembly factor BamB